MKLVIILVLLFCTPVQAEDRHSWTTLDTSLQATYTVLLVMDWRQTQKISESCRSEPTFNTGQTQTRQSTYCDYYETNSFLGKQPSLGTVNAYFASNLVLHPVISYILPKPYRTIWQSIWIGMEGESVIRNYSIGISVTW